MRRVIIVVLVLVNRDFSYFIVAFVAILDSRIWESIELQKIHSVLILNVEKVENIGKIGKNLVACYAVLVITKFLDFHKRNAFVFYLSQNSEISALSKAKMKSENFSMIWWFW